MCVRFRFRSFHEFRLAASGTSAVEFALLCPLFFLFFFGLTAYGIYLGASHSIQQIAAEAARASIAGLDADERTSLALHYISANASHYPLIDPTRVTAQARAGEDDPAQFVVSVSFDARALPIWSLFPGLPLPGTRIEHRSTIRIGGL
ncbi:MAG: pilus assembly protein [Rhizobiaceae bacterium]|nr:pilus assembly protein [Rhizobiaceae bacterium]